MNEGRINAMREMAQQAGFAQQALAQQDKPTPAPEPTVPKAQYDEAIEKVGQLQQEVAMLKQSNAMLMSCVRTQAKVLPP